jgi:hypothetical protein
MRVDEVARELSLEIAAGAESLGREITGAYVGDLLSRVMAGARPGYLWVTVQAHPNVIAVAVLGELSGVVVAEGVRPDSVGLLKAEEEGLPVLTTGLPSFQICVGLARLGIGEVRDERWTAGAEA